VGVPVIVLSNNDGCAIARSAEAKALGIKMGDPIHHLRDKVRQHGIQVRSSNYALYGDMQRRVIAACESFARDFEIYSIDETFLDLAGFEGRDLVAHANAMRAQVQLWTTIPTCLGIADTKTLAKLANAAAKKNPQFGGVADFRDDVRREVVHAFAVGDVWGVGGATARKLIDLGIHTAGALRDMPMKQARAVGTVVLERLVAELRGVPSNAVEAVEPRRKGMAVTRSFGTPICDFEQMMGALSQYALRAGEKLRSHGLVAARLTAFFHTNKHKPERPQYGGSRMVTLHPMTNERLVTTIAAGTVLTPGEWLLERRMLVAERLLKGTELTMADIASRSWMSGAGQLFRARRGTTLNRCEQRPGERTVGDAVSSASDLAAGNWNNDGPLVWPGLEPSARLPR
jgi:nucleotidyltransferase/DNA polymerase involved in DNA repair